MGASLCFLSPSHEELAPMGRSYGMTIFPVIHGEQKNGPHERPVFPVAMRTGITNAPAPPGFPRGD